MSPLAFNARRLLAELGPAGQAALVVFALAAAFIWLAVKPIEARNDQLAERIARSPRHAAPAASNAGEKLAVFYERMAKSEETTDWLAKLYGIGKATGVELQSANYRVQKAGERMERYEIVLPLTGTYKQMREFINRALAEIPVLSLDQLTLRRETRDDGALRAEVRLTLHRVAMQKGNPS